MRASSQLYRPCVSNSTARFQKVLQFSSEVSRPRFAKGYAHKSCFQCIGRESNPGLAESSEIGRSRMATANFTTKPPMLLMEAARKCTIILVIQGAPRTNKCNWKRRRQRSLATAVRQGIHNVACKNIMPGALKPVPARRRSDLQTVPTTRALRHPIHTTRSRATC
jgi:hypothetical protein